MVCEPNGNATYSTCRVWDGARLNDPAGRFQINGLVTAIGSDQNHYLIGTLGGQIHRLDRGFTRLRTTNTNSQVNALVSGGSGSRHWVAIGNDRSATVIDRESGEVIVKLHDFGTEGYIALLDVIPGEDNEITVMARNQDNTILGQGQTVRFKSSLPKAEPHLWILPVGIASFQDSGVRKLASPKKDALDFACSYGGKEALKSAGRGPTLSHLQVRHPQVRNPQVRNPRAAVGDGY